MTTIVGRGATVVDVVEDVDVDVVDVDELVVGSTVVEVVDSTAVVELSSTAGSMPPHAVRINTEATVITNGFMEPGR